MNARVFQFNNWSRTLSGMVAIAVATILLAVFAALVAAPTLVSAQGAAPTNCSEALEVDSSYLDVKFTLGVTETLPGLIVEDGQVLCVQVPVTATIGFSSENEVFYLNGRHYDFSVLGTVNRDKADVLPNGYATFLMTGATTVETVVRMINPPDNLTVDLYVGKFRPLATAPVATPAPAQVPQRPWVYTQLPYSVDYRSGPPSFEFMEDGTTQLQLHATDPFSLTEVSSSETYTATADLNGGWTVFVGDIEDGKWEAPALKGLWWSARFDAVTPDTVFRMRAPKAPAASQASPAATVAGMINVWKNAAGKFFTDGKCTGVAVVFDPAIHNHVGGCSGGRGRIAGAPAPFHYVPLLLIK